MSELAKATLKTILTGLLAGLISLQTQINASGVDNYRELMVRPSTLILILIAMLPVVISSFSKSPAQGAAMDKAIEAKADAKAEMKAEARADNLAQNR